MTIIFFFSCVWGWGEDESVGENLISKNDINLIKTAFNSSVYMNQSLKRL